MNRINLQLISTACIFLFLLTSCRHQNEWPGWRGENRDAKVQGFETPDKWPEQLSQVWETEVGMGNSSPVMVNNQLFLHVRQNEQETALCINAENGEVVWKTELNPAPEVTGGASSHPGPRSTPLIENGKMFTLGVGGIFHCIDTKTGEIIWEKDQYTEVPQFFAAMSPIVADGKCIVHLGGHDHGIILAFNPENGDTIWSIKNEPATYSSPVSMNVAGQHILILQTEKDLLGISTDGKILWRIPTPPEQRFYNSSTPVVDGQNVIVAGQGKGTSSYKIEKTNDEFSFIKNWDNPEYGTSFNTPVLKDGYLYGHEARLGKVYCLDAENGKTAWTDSTAHNRFAAMVDLGDVLLSLPATGKLFIFEPNPEEYSEIAKYKISDSEVYAHPVVAGGKIYVKNETMLICYKPE